MKKFKLGQTVNTLANIGVIVGIVFLIVEIDQNNDSQAFQARATLREVTNSQVSLMIENAGGIADILSKAESGDDLTRTETIQLVAYNAQRMRSLESLYREVQIGALTIDDISIREWRAILNSANGQLLRFVESVAEDGDLDPAFVRFIQEKVLPE